MLAHVVPLPRREGMWSNDSGATCRFLRLVGRKGTSNRSNLTGVTLFQSDGRCMCCHGCQLTCRSLHGVLSPCIAYPENIRPALADPEAMNIYSKTDRIYMVIFLDACAKVLSIIEKSALESAMLFHGLCELVLQWTCGLVLTAGPSGTGMTASRACRG